MAVPYHTHTFEIPQASKDDVLAGVSTELAVVPAALGTSATKNIEDFATASQGQNADSAVQPGDLAAVATSGSYTDLTNRPTLGTAAEQDSTAFATALQGGKADTAVQPADLGSAAYQNTIAFATAAQGAKADTAVQPARTVSAGAGLTGGGTLAANREIALNSTSIASLALADSAVQSVNGKTGRSITLAAEDVGAVSSTRDTEITANTAARHTHSNKAILDATTASYTTALNTKMSGIEAGAQVNTVTSVAGKTGAVTLTKGDVGLGSVDNTADLAKPISTATQAALNGKASAAQGAKADTAIQAPGGAAGQVLTKNSATSGDVLWQTVAAATAVSYAPQSLTEPQQTQARANISAQLTGATLEALRAAPGAGANQLSYMVSATAAAFTPLTVFARSILDDANGAAMFSTMGTEQSLSTSGYIKLPSGLIIQWGLATGFTGGGLSVVYPIAFPNARFCSVVTPAGEYAVGPHMPSMYISWTASLTNLTIWCRSQGVDYSNINAHWISVGR